MSSISYIRRIGAHTGPEGEPRRLASYVPAAMLAEAGRRAQWLQELGGLWESLVGASLAPHSTPVGYRGGRLTIQADAPVWADRLRRQQRRLLHTLQGRPVFADLSEIRIRVRPREGAPGQAPPKGAGPGLSSQSAALLAALAEAVPDPELGAALRRLSRRAGPGRSR